MKTPEELQAAIDEIAAVCRKHRIVLVGTCGTESIYGEITIFDADNPDVGWRDLEEHTSDMNRVTIDQYAVGESDPYVLSIGGWYP